jgi:hypothetical protein
VGNLEAVAIRRSLRTRLCLTGAVLGAAGLGTALALGAAGEGGAPSIEVDSSVPLFTLRGMAPGDAPVDRCIAVSASGGSAPRLSISAVVSGGLAPDLRMEVAAGPGPLPGAGHSCAGFVPERQLWAGALADFPTAGAPVVDDAPLPSGAHRVYRFRVELPSTATGTGGAQATATQDIRWTAELEPDPTSRIEAEGSIVGTGSCAAVVDDFPRRTFVIAGRRVTLLLGPVRLITADTALGLRVKSPKGLVRSATYRVDGQPIAAGTQWPWSADVAPARLHAPTTDITAIVRPVRGPSQSGTVSLRVRPCPTLARAVAGYAHPRSIVLRFDSGRALRGATVLLPAGIEPGTPRGEIIVWAGNRQRTWPLRASGRPSVRARGRRLEVADLPAGAGLVEIRLGLPRATWAALALARCARAQVTTRLATATRVTIVRHPLLGRGGGCPAP